MTDEAAGPEGTLGALTLCNGAAFPRSRAPIDSGAELASRSYRYLRLIRASDTCLTNGRCVAGAIGTVKKNVVPRSAALSTQMRPS